MSVLDTNKFSDMIKSKRNNEGLRATAREIGISPSTLSRVEKGNLPDIDTYLILCNWLEVSSDFFKIQNSISNSTEENVIAHLRADRTLAPETSEALIKMINLAYAANK